jgi:hypothetical protein
VVQAGSRQRKRGLMVKKKKKKKKKNKINKKGLGEWNKCGKNTSLATTKS